MTRCRSLLAVALLAGVGAAMAASSEDEVVKQYVEGCHIKAPRAADCDQLKSKVVPILKDDLLTLGSSADRVYLPAILSIFRSDEPQLRIAAADALGMIGPKDRDFPALLAAANDPVPGVRHAVRQAIGHSGGEALDRLFRRMTAFGGVSLNAEQPPDLAKMAMPAPTGGQYLYFASDTFNGRLAYSSSAPVSELAAFFRSRAKHPPSSVNDFAKAYQDQIDDENAGRVERDLRMQIGLGKPDPKDAGAYQAWIARSEALTTSDLLPGALDEYPPELFGNPIVFVLEERQIASRVYPTRFAVVYEDLVLKRAGYRLCWTAVSDDLIQAQQQKSIADQQKRASARQASEAAKKKKDAAREQFNKGASDLEKQLGL